MKIPMCKSNTLVGNLLRVLSLTEKVPKTPIINSCRANSFAERLRLGLAVIHGEQKETNQEIDGRNSPPPPESEGLDTLEPIAALPSVTPSKRGQTNNITVFGFLSTSAYQILAIINRCFNLRGCLIFSNDRTTYSRLLGA